MQKCKNKLVERKLCSSQADHSCGPPSQCGLGKLLKSWFFIICKYSLLEKYFASKNTSRIYCTK